MEYGIKFKTKMVITRIFLNNIHSGLRLFNRHVQIGELLFRLTKSKSAGMLCVFVTVQSHGTWLPRVGGAVTK